MTDHILVGGRYRLGDPLGHGGMGEVRLGLDVRLGRPVAVKLLAAELSTDPAARERFRREARSSARLNHPGIVGVLDTGEDLDEDSGTAVPYIVMELVDGQTLKALLLRGHGVTPARALRIAEELLAALAHTHEAGIVHSDVKPDNVMLTSTGEVKLMDFGIARGVIEDPTPLPREAGVLGTAKYFSPEHARAGALDARSDVYSVGCVLYELLAGRPPFVGDSILSIASQHLHDQPLAPSRRAAAVRPEVDAVVLRALAKDPATRYQSAGEMREAVAGLLRSGTVAVAPAVVVPLVAAVGARSRVDHRAVASSVAATPRRALERPAGRRRKLVLVAAAVAGLVFPVGGVGLEHVLDPSSESAAGADLATTTTSDSGAAQHPGGQSQATTTNATTTTDATTTIRRQGSVAASTAEPVTAQVRLTGAAIRRAGTGTDPTATVPSQPAQPATFQLSLNGHRKTSGGHAQAVNGPGPAVGATPTDPTPSTPTRGNEPTQRSTPTTSQGHHTSPANRAQPSRPSGSRPTTSDRPSAPTTSRPGTSTQHRPPVQHPAPQPTPKPHPAQPAQPSTPPAAPPVVHPADPAGPSKPAHPTKRPHRAKASQPTKPTHRTKRAHPTSSAHRTKQAHPAQPGHRSKPGPPHKRSHPAKPPRAAKPPQAPKPPHRSTSTHPAKPSPPAKPPHPAKSTHPAKPAHQGKPSHPTKAPKPAKPAPPTQAVDPVPPNPADPHPGKPKKPGH